MSASAGTVLTRFTMRIELGKVREFARATGSNNEEYFTSDTPPIPPTFLTTSAFWQPTSVQRPYEALGMDLRRVLHGQQTYRFFAEQPVRAGDVLDVEIRIDSVTEKQGRRGGTMRIAEIVTDFRDPTGVLVAEGRSTTIEIGAAPT